MTDVTPNDQQQKLIDATEGTYLVDAGAGTGKTFTVTRRYANVLDQNSVEPDDLLLLTFTNNAADEMKDRIVSHCEYSMAALRDAPISTFHSLAHDILLQYGFEAPQILGIDDRITSTTQLLDNEVIENERFQEFTNRFIREHPEYEDYFRVLSDDSSLLGLIKQLAAKGVFPTREGWFRHGERYLDGDFEEFKECFIDANAPNEGKSGPTQSDLRSSLGGYGDNKCYLPDAPSETELRGEGGTKQIDTDWADRVFEEERSELKGFVHDLYFEYIEFALSRNYLNFSFLLLFAFALLCEDHGVREEFAFEYTMIDEFQDTSEIQFKLALLLAGTDNICVVGDWKQSIYSFQYASVDNIRHFEERLQQYRDELNDDSVRIEYPIDDVTEIELVENYRSTQEILDFSECSLTLPATQSEELDTEAIQERIVSLEANSEASHSRIEAITGDDEHEALLDRIQTIVGNTEYRIADGEAEGGFRPPEYDDIAVLTRTRRFGREFQKRASQYGFPMAYEGGVELFETDQALLLLAWLRILENDADRGWAVVLERAGYTIEEADQILERSVYPSNMKRFRDELASIETIGGIAHRVFERYGYDDAYADTLMTTLEEVFSSTHLNRGEVIQFIERSLEAESTHEVDDCPSADAVTVQTIHAAKGLEHPIVILANLNQYNFPSMGGGGDAIRYNDIVGLRQTKEYSTAHGLPHVYHSWRHDVRSSCLPREYDEERRLLYVAMTRAKDHLLFSAETAPSPFFENLPLKPARIEPDVQSAEADNTVQSHLQITVPKQTGPISQSPHSLIDDSVFEGVTNGEGTAFGQRVHEFAEQYILGEVDAPATGDTEEDEQNVQRLIDSLNGELHAEKSAYLPLTIGGEQVTISGVIDLLCVTPDEVTIIDYKTDRGQHAHSEYRKQISVYYHVVRQSFPDRDISASVLYTETGSQEPVESLTEAELKDLVQAEIANSQEVTLG
ncbi:UvrD-helicase domain-containing protein [Halococcus salsus]|uniref:UvrD-helicase domain-containing protein n=1 Tax=Halococcus salsus TaxID=2162894 RepID=UPI00135C4EDD|nr:ATP-dependent DNA helicase [Halococcus salsus]